MNATDADRRAALDIYHAESWTVEGLSIFLAERRAAAEAVVVARLAGVLGLTPEATLDEVCAATAALRVRASRGGS